MNYSRFRRRVVRHTRKEHNWRHGNKTSYDTYKSGGIPDDYLRHVQIPYIDRPDSQIDVKTTSFDANSYTAQHHKEHNEAPLNQNDVTKTILWTCDICACEGGGDFIFKKELVVQKFEKIWCDLQHNRDVSRTWPSQHSNSTFFKIFHSNQYFIQLNTIQSSKAGIQVFMTITHLYPLTTSQ